MSLIVLLIAFTLPITCWSFTNETKLPEYSQTSSKGDVGDNLQAPALSTLEIDIASCICLHEAQQCEIAIAKSSVLKINCPSNHTYCCGISKKSHNLKEQINKNDSKDITLISHFNEHEDIPEKESEIETENNGNDKSNQTFIDEYQSVLRLSKEATKPPMNKNTNKRCLCKAREQCPQEYVDYGFGFDCNYNTVRCCEPETDIFKDSSRLIYIQKPSHVNSRTNLTNSSENHDSISTMMNEEDEDIIEPRCYCLPYDQCNRMEENVIWRREDTLCPEDLIKCCGSPALEKSDQQISNENQYDQKEEEEINSSFENEEKIVYHQPIQLTELKIPMTEEYTDQKDRESSATLPPPPLPTYYNYQPPKYYAGFYNPTSGQESYHHNIPNPTQTQNYGGNEYVGYPWRSQIPFQYSDHVQNYPTDSKQNHPFSGETPRGYNPQPSLLNKISSFLG